MIALQNILDYIGLFVIHFVCLGFLSAIGDLTLPPPGTLPVAGMRIGKFYWEGSCVYK
ncbi:hypothetical protein BDV33DRAFT_121976 [Aspergillus novoparasiticus]|uniref:Uncharacterized protein n=1 Tax=Aspergillus novoparasiticus TaxID=986946 RepID=A0A5N6ELN9_9EURO|nr:hypothetical protein BDV33DRAFT_121976 [Aspergillus novoparasiticus]